MGGTNEGAILMEKYTVTINVPNRPKGDPIEVSGLGVIENGSSATAMLDDDLAESIRNTEGFSIKKGGGGKVDYTAPTEVEATVIGAESEEGGEDE